MSRKERIEDTLNAGMRCARHKAYLPWNQSKIDWNELSYKTIFDLLVDEIKELNTALQDYAMNENSTLKRKRECIENVLSEVGDVINFACMIADNIENGIGIIKQ